MYSLILPLGIINLVLVLIQILGGLKVIGIPYKTHKKIGIVLGVFVVLHATIAIVYT
jgi:hypothetical protein